MKPSVLDSSCVNTIRFLSVDMVEKANSGRPGLPMGAAPMAYVLWTRFRRHNPKNPSWWDRDRFVLSAGHGSALLYSLLHLTGYDLSLDQIKRFRQWKSETPGHPESQVTHGVEATTVALGQGIGNALGMAIGEPKEEGPMLEKMKDVRAGSMVSVRSDGSPKRTTRGCWFQFSKRLAAMAVAFRFLYELGADFDGFTASAACTPK